MGTELSTTAFTNMHDWQRELDQSVHRDHWKVDRLELKYWPVDGQVRMTPEVRVTIRFDALRERRSTDRPNWERIREAFGLQIDESSVAGVDLDGTLEAQFTVDLQHGALSWMGSFDRA